MTPACIIAEAGVNHNGSLDLARKLVDAAHNAGADAVKFQTFKADKIASRSAAKAEYQTRTTGSEEGQLEMLRRLELTEDAHHELLAHCRTRGIEFISTPFDLESLAFLVSRLGVGRIKIGSGDLTNAPLLLAAARSGLPMIVSTGMATLGEIEEALGVLAFGFAGVGSPPGRNAFADAYFDPMARRQLVAKVTLLHCTTEYPAPFEDANLRVIDTLNAAFGLPVGFSDHTVGTSIAIAAVARGASVIEKHVTLDRGLPGPDHKASLEPHELKAMIAAIREVGTALGDGFKVPRMSERKNISVARKSLVASRPVRKGEVLDAASIAIKRPGGGPEPITYWDWLGTEADRDYAADELLGRPPMVHRAP